MAADDADVTKALAAFGAPSIRYRSFGQSSGRTSSIVTPRRDVGAAAASNAEPGQAAKVERPPSQGVPEAVPMQAAAAPSRLPPSLAEWAPPVEPTRAAPVASPVSRLPPAGPPALTAMRPLTAEPSVRGIPDRTLAEVFALLASAPPGAPRAPQATPEIFRQG